MDWRAFLVAYIIHCMIARTVVWSYSKVRRTSIGVQASALIARHLCAGLSSIKLSMSKEQCVCKAPAEIWMHAWGMHLAAADPNRVWVSGCDGSASAAMVDRVQAGVPKPLRELCNNVGQDPD